MPCAGYVYIIHGTGTPYLKIGKTTNILKRLQHLQQGVPFALQLVSVTLVADMDAAEQALLEQYQALRARGEWFEVPLDVLERWPLPAMPTPIARAYAAQHTVSDRTRQILDILRDEVPAKAIAAETGVCLSYVYRLRRRFQDRRWPKTA
jgi:hypothetical protein